MPRRHAFLDLPAKTWAEVTAEDANNFVVDNRSKTSILLASGPTNAAPAAGSREGIQLKASERIAHTVDSLLPGVNGGKRLFAWSEGAGQVFISHDDITAPVLSAPADEAASGNTMTGSVTTDEGEGTLFWVVTTTATTPSAAQVKAGQDSAGVAATASGSQAVSASGIQYITDGGFAATTQYYTHYVQDDTSANTSAVVTADGFISVA